MQNPIIPTPAIAARLEKRTVRGPTEDACWGWSACVDDRGYGRIAIKVAALKIHRVAYAVHYGVDPGDLDVCHRCDNPPCTNPRHLFLGTHRDNMRDAKKKGRLNAKPAHQRPHNIGEHNGQARLTDLQVKAIRTNVRKGRMSPKMLALQYGVKRAYVYQLVNGRSRTKPTPKPSSPSLNAQVNTSHSS